MNNQYDIENNLNQPYIPINSSDSISRLAPTCLVLRYIFLYTMVYLSFLFSLYCIVLDIKYGSQGDYYESRTTDIIIWYTMYSLIFCMAISIELQRDKGIYAHLFNTIFALIIITRYFRYYNDCKTTDDNNNLVSCSDLLPLQLKVHVYMAISSSFVHMIGLVIWGFCYTLRKIIK